MDTFVRRMAVEALAAHRSNRGLAALFARWVLPGEEAGAYGLRLAIRNGYLNFYVKGQSVGELRLVGKLPRLKLHRKYRDFVERGHHSATSLPQQYDTIDTDALASTTADVIDRWIVTAETYAGDEKRFVDDLVAVTPGTIDLEMGLPADDDPLAKKRSAPRMDLVVAQGSDIAFWEAKCAVNAELRARATYREFPDGSYIEGPHVLWQLRRYERWVGRPHRLEQVREAYVHTACLLIELAKTFGKRGPATDSWRQFIACREKAAIVLPPGIVIADYCPTRADGAHRAETPTYWAKASSFGQHEKRLLRHGATVVRLHEKPSHPVLPELRPAAISDVEQYD